MGRLNAGLILAAAALLSAAPSGQVPPTTSPAERPKMTVPATEDFEITGAGSHKAWDRAAWTTLRRRQAEGHPYESRVKLMHSATGLYLLMDAEDKKLTATMTEDFMDLWNEDVFEAFFWPDEKYPVYFEYQISPLNRELAILIPNFGGQFLGWRPWHYEKDRLTRKAVHVRGGDMKSHAAVAGWSGEIFIPYALLRPLQNVPPKPGTRWRANFYRMDYDDGTRTQWWWSPVRTNFHDYENFGELIFAPR